MTEEMTARSERNRAKEDDERSERLPGRCAWLHEFLAAVTEVIGSPR